MKNFFIKVIVFFILMVIVDYTSGIAFDYLQLHAKGGMTKRDNYICNELKTDILLCGSSRCIHHYNPNIISDSLGLTCYNSGQRGNGIIFQYGRLSMIKERSEPKVIIYDITPSFDLLLGEDNHKYLTWLKPHYNRKGIPAVFHSVDKTEKIKMLSNMYRFNSHFIELVADYVSPTGKTDNKGYVPLNQEFDKTKVKRDNQSAVDTGFDPLKIEFLLKFIDEFDGKLIFVVSPMWYGMDTGPLQPLIDICNERQISFLDFANNPKYVHNDAYFKDGAHLNSRGADEFTKDLVIELRMRGCISQ